MVYKILDTNMEPQFVFDAFESLIWTQRFAECGEFEIVTLATEELINEFVIGYYILSDMFYDEETDEAKLMIIETVEITSDVDDGAKLTIKGRSLESLWERRVLYDAVTFYAGKPCYQVLKELFVNNFISPEDHLRRVSKFQWEDPPSDISWTNLVIDMEYTAMSVYEAAKDLCERYHIGYETVYNFTKQKFISRMIIQQDRSYDQVKFNPVVFSPGFGNLINSNYLNSKADYANVARIHGADLNEGDVTYRVNMVYRKNTTTETTGFNRREIYVDASDISWDDENQNRRSRTEYENLIRNKGIQEINLHGEVKTYEAEADITRGFTFREDYDLGDVVEIINEFEISSKVIIAEIVLAEDQNGFSVVPTFVEKSEEVITT